MLADDVNIIALKAILGNVTGATFLVYKFLQSEYPGSGNVFPPFFHQQGVPRNALLLVHHQLELRLAEADIGDDARYFGI